jgi:hypothetical protein
VVMRLRIEAMIAYGISISSVVAVLAARSARVRAGT